MPVISENRTRRWPAAALNQVSPSAFSSNRRGRPPPTGVIQVSIDSLAASRPVVNVTPRRRS